MKGQSQSVLFTMKGHLMDYLSEELAKILQYFFSGFPAL